jgi:surface protein
MYRSLICLLLPLWFTISINAQFAQFTTTDELYAAVDNYMANSTSNTTISAIKYGYPMGTWDVSLLSNFSRVFYPNRTIPLDGSGCGEVLLSPFNENLSGWRMNNAQITTGMFACTEFNQPIGSWVMSSITNMSGMFMYSVNFDQDISGWDTSSVVDMSYVFAGAESFRSSIGSWNVGKVTDMRFMVSNPSIHEITHLCGS